jgi:uncharacterized protein (DUF697 family)
MDREARADELIQGHVAGAVAAAAIPVPVVDLVAVTAVQLRMLRRLGRLYGASIGVGIQGALAVGLLGAVLPRVAASALKLLPGIGTVGGAVAQAALSGAATWTLAQALREELGEEGVRLDRDREAGVDVARALARAERLWRRGLISDDEFVRMRAELLAAV